MPEVSLSAWQDFLRPRPDAHLLQSGEWGELKAAFGWRAVRLICGDLGAQILLRSLAPGLAMAYMPKPLAPVPASGASGPFWSEVAALCRRERAVFLKVEPDAWVEESPAGWPAAFRTSSHNIQPPRTIVLSLRETEEAMLARMKQKTRYNIRLAEKKGVRVRNWEDLDAFHRMLQQTGGRDQFGVHSLAYYRRAYELFHPGGSCELLVAEHEGRPLAALMVFARGSRAWYLYGASDSEDRNLMPTYLLQWEAMRWARSRGCEEYDLWGVPDAEAEALEHEFEGRGDGLWGVYRFKRGFGGELKRAAQAVDWVYRPFWYRLYLWRMGGAVD